jgi:hypothetical protein
MVPQYGVIMKEVLAAWMLETETELLMDSREQAPRGETGRFTELMYPRSFILGNTYEMEIHSASDKPKAIWIRDGTAEHPIIAHGTALLFQIGSGQARTSGQGADVFIQQVIHPAHAPNLWGDDVLLSVGNRQIARLDAMIQERFAIA